jgi:RNA polymerase sigma-B factor
MEIGPGPGAPSEVRAWLGFVFGLRGPVALDVEVMVSELVLHAIETGSFDDGDCVEITADRPPGAIHIEVTYPSPGGLQRSGDEVGFDVLDARASVWGTVQERDRCTVWFEEAIPSAGWELEVSDDSDLIDRIGLDERASAELIERYAPLVGRFAGRYRRAGLESDDLQQVGHEALLRAAQRFDPNLGSFERFASRTISGTLKRHLRDRGWSVRPPRGLQELVLELRRVEQTLVQALGREPTVEELAQEVGRSPGEVERASVAATAFDIGSLDATLESGDRPLGDMLGSTDAAMARAAGWVAVDEAIELLADRERDIVRLRYFDDLSQRQIAERVGVSQMHVSRLLRESIDTMREALGVSGAR